MTIVSYGYMDCMYMVILLYGLQGNTKEFSSVTSERVYLTAQEKQMRQSENQII